MGLKHATAADVRSTCCSDTVTCIVVLQKAHACYILRCADHQPVLVLLGRMKYLSCYAALQFVLQLALQCVLQNKEAPLKIVVSIDASNMARQLTILSTQDKLEDRCRHCYSTSKREKAGLMAQAASTMFGGVESFWCFMGL